MNRSGFPPQAIETGLAQIRARLKAVPTGHDSCVPCLHGLSRAQWQPAGHTVARHRHARACMRGNGGSTGGARAVHVHPCPRNPGHSNHRSSRSASKTWLDAGTIVACMRPTPPRSRRYRNAGGWKPSWISCNHMIYRHNRVSTGLKAEAWAQQQAPDKPVCQRGICGLCCKQVSGLPLRPKCNIRTGSHAVKNRQVIDTSQQVTDSGHIPIMDTTTQGRPAPGIEMKKNGRTGIRVTPGTRC